MAIDYWALASVLAGTLTIALMIWIAIVLKKHPATSNSHSSTKKRNFVTAVTALLRDRPYSYTMRKEGFAMRHILSVIVVATLLVATAVDVIAGWTKMDASRNNHYAAPMTGISIALPSGMKSFPVELPQ